MRYARALLKSATALKIEDSVCQDMMCLGRSYIEVPQLRTAIATPMLQPEKKELLLVTAAGTEPTELTHLWQAYHRYCRDSRYRGQDAADGGKQDSWNCGIQY